MRILHTIAGLWEGTGGPVASVTSLCAGLAARGHDVTLLTGSGPLAPAVTALGSKVRVRTERLGPYRLSNWSPAFARACLEEARRADVVHDHGVWLHTNRSSVRMANRAGRSVVRSPRGMLSPWAMNRSRLLKRVVWELFERRLFDKAALVHVTSDLERRDLARLGIAAPAVVIPNGVDLEGEFAPSRVAQARSGGIPEAQGRRVVLYLSRVHPVKGIDLLWQAWTTLPSSTPAELIVAGPGDSSAVAMLRRWLAEQKGPPARYVGPTTGAARLALLSSAWLLVLPSHSENYGMVVAEALACGTPVVTTTAMPWAEVEAAGCGWVIPPESEPLAAAVAAALRLSPPEHAAMSTRARALVEGSHSLTEGVARMESCYQRLIAPDSKA